MRDEYVERIRNIDLSISNREYLVYKYLLNDLQYAFNKYSKGKLLDIGCGNKPYSSLMPSAVSDYLGCDIVQSSQKLVDVICEATDIPLPDNTFDTILSTQTIEHIYDHKKMLKEASRLLRQGGSIILSGPMYWPLHEEPYDYFRFTKYGFRALLEEAGFKVLEELSNGGKWALLGQTIIHTLYPDIDHFKTKKVRFFKMALNIFGGVSTINKIFSALDDKTNNYVSTMNYVFVAQKL